MQNRLLHLALALALAACGGASDDADGRKLVAAERRCAIPIPTGSGLAAPDIDDIAMKVCRALAADQSPRLAAEVKCSELASCDDFIVCKNAAFATYQVRPKVDTAIAQGRIRDAWNECTFNEDYLTSPAFVRVCEPAFVQAPAILSGKDLDEALYRCNGNPRMLRAAPALAASCDAIRRGHEPAR